MKLIFIHGPAAVGKLTVGKALEDLTHFRLFHNHLVVDTLLAVFQFGTEPFVRLRETIWLSVFEEAARGHISLIFTFAPEATVDPAFIDKTIGVVSQHGGEVHFVELVCPIEEQERRIENPSRAQFLKLRSLKTLRVIRESTARKFPKLPSGLTIDTGVLAPSESARQICDFFNLPVAVTKREVVHYPTPKEKA